MVELGIVGSKNSGKTTVIEGLIKYLAGEGYRVATIKHSSHSHRFDTPGKDSDRHRQAGAHLTIAVSKEETAIFAKSDSLDVDQIQRLTAQQIDLWLIEGDRLAARPKVLVTQNLTESPDSLPQNIVATIGPESIDTVPRHFAAGNYEGLGSFVLASLLGKKT